MHRQFLFFLALLLSTSLSFAQRVTVREDFNPVTDSLEWVVGHKDWAEVYVGKAESENALLKIVQLVLAPYQTTSRDSAWLFLQDGHLIKAANAKALPSRREKYWAGFVDLELDYIELLLPIRTEDLRRLAQSNVTKVTMRFYAPNPEQQKNFARNLRKGLTKLSPVTVAQDYVEVTHHKVRRRWQKLVVRAATMAAEYEQGRGDSNLHSADFSSENP